MKIISTIPDLLSWVKKRKRIIINVMTSKCNYRQDKILTRHEIAKLKQSGVDIHDLKGGKNASKKDLYKDEQGNIYIKLKGGIGLGEVTGLNLNDFW